MNNYALVLLLENEKKNLNIKMINFWKIKLIKKLILKNEKYKLIIRIN